jgi:hypothetical protein
MYDSTRFKGASHTAILSSEGVHSECVPFDMGHASDYFPILVQALHRESVAPPGVLTYNIITYNIITYN